MKRSAACIDFLLVTLAVTTILLSLLPLVAKQQSPMADSAIDGTPQKLATASRGAVELPRTKRAAEVVADPRVAVARWQSEVDTFYARRDQHTQRDAAKTLQSPESTTTSAVQTVSYDVAASPKPSLPVAKTSSASTSAQSLPKTHFGVVLQDRHVPMTFFFSICGGLLLALGYLEWSRQTPEVKPVAIEFHDSQDEVTHVAFDPKWGTLKPSKSVTARRATLASVVIWALASLVL
ncbi:hypothetical protein [Planctomycetes bacterium K23_9]|uniref:Uncharacterized protein n=1 Tax=Stieleria marina TaxID=1930275 RepID=A0A517NW38_9BACT|nr:hypothetical protein K239x_33370 [Planctomycetes bacterium K23_9]